MTHIYNGTLLSHKKNEIMPFATTPLNLETIILSGIGHAEKGKITYLYHFYVESKRIIQMNLFSKNRLKK